MHSPKLEERRQSPRHRIYRMAKIEFGVGIQARDCRVIDLSDDGVRLQVEGFNVPDEFVLLLSGDGIVRESTYKVVSRRGHQVVAKFASVIRSGFALRH